ncbi:terminase [Castellaniella caeni]|uniref:terminase n=1 Tax=Castellaniella caeni TaxID=266123 RepID=UPI001CA5A5F5|nr:terminase [Castellaniella caeni]
MPDSGLSEIDLQLADEIARFYADPLGFVIFAFDWGRDPALRLCKLPEPWSFVYNTEFGPDRWACELLDRVGQQVRERGFDGVHAVPAIREAVASGHGIGKSTITAWIILWIMSTRPYAKGTVTANTLQQLENKTWAELDKWNGKCITGHWFDVSTGRGSLRMQAKVAPTAWFCAGQSCREENSEAFAGQHAADSTPFYIFDEASGIPDKIWEVAEGGLTDGEPMFFAFGNPTQNSGKFYDCFNAQRHRWGTRQIDSREVQISNKDTINEWISDYGENSDFVKVRVRGMFPAMSAKQFISVPDADAALGKHLRVEQYSFAPKILTCDPAWEGDDELVIGLRQGLRFDVLRTIPKNDNDVQIATLLASLEDEHAADGVIIDFGYGTGIYSAGQTMGRDWLLADFGSKSPDAGCLNLRAFMWREMRDWLKAGGAIPNDKVLYADLIAPQTVPRADGVIQLEAKKDMKRRNLPSPNRADALALSFAFPITRKQHVHVNRQDTIRGHDPYEAVSPRGLDEHPAEHNPYENL